MSTEDTTSTEEDTPTFIPAPAAVGLIAANFLDSFQTYGKMTGLDYDEFVAFISGDALPAAVAAGVDSDSPGAKLVLGLGPIMAQAMVVAVDIEREAGI